MERQEKVKMLKAILEGQSIDKALKEDLGWLIIKMSEDEYWCPSIAKTLTHAELKLRLTDEEINEKAKVVFILPDNKRD